MTTTKKSCQIQLSELDPELTSGSAMSFVFVFLRNINQIRSSVNLDVGPRRRPSWDDDDDDDTDVIDGETETLATSCCSFFFIFFCLLGGGVPKNKKVATRRRRRRKPLEGRRDVDAAKAENPQKKQQKTTILFEPVRADATTVPLFLFFYFLFPFFFVCQVIVLGQGLVAHRSTGSFLP